MTTTICGVARNRAGDAVPNALIRFYQLGELIASAVANGYGKWEATLDAGVYDMVDQDGDTVSGLVFVDASAQVVGNWYTDTGAPSDGDGNNGDFYTDTDTSIIYFKEDDAWVVKNTPHVPAWTTGVIAPDNGDGANGDFYTDTVAGKIYYKSGGTWAAKATFALPV